MQRTDNNRDLPHLAAGDFAGRSCENWAYIAEFVMPAFFPVADTAYGNRTASCSTGARRSRRVRRHGRDLEDHLVGGATPGPRIYRLDITDPRNPKACGSSCDPTTFRPHRTFVP